MTQPLSTFDHLLEMQIVEDQQRRMYDAVFQFLDSIPTITFTFFFLPFYLALFPVIHSLLQRTISYSSLEYRKQSNILCNVAQLSILVPISLIGLTALWRGDISLIHTDKHKPNVQVSKFCHQHFFYFFGRC